MRVLRFCSADSNHRCTPLSLLFTAALFVLVLMMVSPTFAQTGAAPIPNGLTNWWRAEGNALDTQSGVNGTLNNGAGFTAGEVGQGFNFDGGSGSNVVLPASVASFATNDFTVDFWFNTTQFENFGNPITLLGNRVDCSDGNFFSVRMYTNNSLFVELDQDGAHTNYSSVQSASGLNDGKWHHVAAVRLSNTLSLYIDGTLAGTSSSSGVTNITGTNPFFVGASPCTSGYTGAIDEIHIFNRALSQTEVQSIYNAATVGLTTLVGWWKFDEGTGATTADSSGNGNTGTLSGSVFPAWTNDVPSVPFADPFSLSFDGSTSYVNVANGATSSALNFTTQVSMAAWVKPAIVQAGTFGIISKPRSSSGTGWTLRMEAGTTNFGLNNGFVNCSVHASANPFTAGTWTHLVATYDASTSNVQLYVNGTSVPVDNQGCTGPLTLSAFPLQIGQEFGPGGGRNFPGEIDEARVYNRILSAGEVAALAASVSPLSTTINATATSVLAGAANPTLTAMPNGGVAPYTYLWSTSATTQSISASAANQGTFTYSVTVTDASGKQTSASTNLTVQSPFSPPEPPITLPAATGASVIGGNNASLTDTFVTPYTASQTGWITSWQAQFIGQAISTGPVIPAGVQLKIFRSVGNDLQVVAAGPVNDPRPILQQRFPNYPNFLTTDSLTTFNDPPIPVSSGDYIGITIYADPHVGEYFYPLVGPAGTLQVQRNVGIGQSILPADPQTLTVAAPPALAFTLSPASAGNPLSLQNNYFVTGDYASAGVTLRGTGSSGMATGTITIPTYSGNQAQGVPDGADIIAAYLYWQTLENTPSPSAGSGTFRGYSIAGQKIGKDVAYTDGAFSGMLRVYRADVNPYFPANGAGVRFASGAHTVTLPDSGGTGLPLTEGASLVVIYRVLSPQFPLKAVVIYDGSGLVTTTPLVQVMQGFYDAAGAAQGNAQVKTTDMFSAGGGWNNALNFETLVSGSQFDAVLNAGAHAGVVISTAVNNSDNDGILDGWKTGPAAPDFHAGQAGYYDVKDGAWVGLPGAQHRQKDLFVQLDYMCGSVLANGTCAPTQENLFPSPDSSGNDPLLMVQQAFASRGIVLHTQIGNAVPEDSCTDNLSMNPPQLCQFPGQTGVVGWKNSLLFSKVWPRNFASCLSGGDCSQRFPHGQKDSYHYVLFGHSLAVPAWNSRFGTLVSIQVVNGVTTLVTADRGAGLQACPSRITISGVLGNPSLNGVYNTTGCSDTRTMTIATPGVSNWSYPNNTLPEPIIGITSGIISSISGYSDLGGADSAVTLGLWETSPNQDMSKKANVIAGTLFHEIGHTLGLTHGGLYFDTAGSFVPTFEANCKPNYQSIMNYLFQLDGIGTTHAIDFSSQTLTMLNESQAGTYVQLSDISNAPASYPTSAWYVPFTPGAIASPATRHCDGTPLSGDSAYRVDSSVEPISPAWANGQDINFDGQLNSMMRGYNDWANIDLRQVGATGGQFDSLSGTLSFGAGAAPVNVGAGGNVTLGSGGTIALGSGGSVTLGSGGNVTLGSGGTIALGSGGNVTLGSGGTVTLGSGGVVTAGSDGNVTLGSGGNVTLSSGGTITLGSGGTVALGSGGTVALGSGGTIALGSGGTVTLGAGGSYTLDSQGGTITLGSGGNVTLGSGGNVTLGSGGTIALGSGGNVTLGSGGNVTLGSGGSVALGSGGNVTLGSGGNVTLGSGGTITLGSGGNVTLGSGGNVTLGSGGTVTLGSGGNVALGSGGNVTLGSGGTVTLGSGGNVTLGSGGNVTLGSGGTIALGSGGNVTLGSGGNVTLGSGGTVTLGSGGTITLGSGGTVTLGSGGTITLGSGGAPINEPAGTYTIGSGGTVTLGSGGNVTLGSGGNVTLGSGGTITLGSGGNVTLGSGGNVTLGSGGTITLGSGGTITLGSGGNVTLGSGGVVALGSGGNIALGSGGTIALGSGGNVTLGSGGKVTDELSYETANSVVRPPASPTVTPTPVGARVNWMPPAFGVVATYTVYRAVNGGTPAPIGSVGGNPPMTTFTDPNPVIGGTSVYTISTAVVPDPGQTQTRQSPPSPPAVVKTDQTIAFAPLPGVQLVDSPITVTAIANSGLQVGFAPAGSCSLASSPTITSGVSSVTVKLTTGTSGTGNCTITASQGGNAMFNAATPVSQTFGITGGNPQVSSQTISFAPLSNKTYGDPDFAVSAAASSGMPTLFTAGGNCTASGATVHITGFGACAITASQSGNASFNSAAPVTQSFSIARANATVSVTPSSPNPSDYDAPVTVAATIIAQSASTVLVNEGTVAFYSDSGTTPICMARPANNLASCQTAAASPLSVSTGHVITAAYVDPGGNFNGSPSSTQVTQVVNKRQTTLTVTFTPASPVSVYTVTTVKVTVNDSDANGTPILPGGTVTLQSTENSDAFSATSCTLDNTGSCSVTFMPVVPDGRYITATYSGDNVHLPSDNSAQGATNLMVTAAINTQQVCLSAPFNGTAIPSGDYVWFNGVFQLRGQDLQMNTLTHLSFFNQTIALGNLPAISVPDSEITIDPNATSATTTFDATNNLWQTRIPTGVAGKLWLGGVSYPVPAGGLPGGVKPVTWCGFFASDNPNLNVGWQWAAAAYSNQFTTSYNALGVKPVDDSKISIFQNSDQAGTPENFKSYVIGGARGGGGSNYTGGYSGSLDPNKN